MTKKETALAGGVAKSDPFGLLRHMTSDFDRFFDEPFGLAFRWPSLRSFTAGEEWVPSVDVFEKNHQLITRVDLPGVKKENVHVDVTDGHLAISGERMSEAEEKKDNVYRSERFSGSFSRVVPLPEGVKLDEIKATFTDGVLEVSVPLPAMAAPASRSVPIGEAGKPKSVAA